MALVFPLFPQFKDGAGSPRYSGLVGQKLQSHRATKYKQAPKRSKVAPMMRSKPERNLSPNRTKKTVSTSIDIRHEPATENVENNSVPIFMPTWKSFISAEPKYTKQSFPIYPSEILSYRKEPEKTLVDIRSTQSVLAKSINKSLLPQFFPIPVTPASAIGRKKADVKTRSRIPQKH